MTTMRRKGVASPLLVTRCLGAGNRPRGRAPTVLLDYWQTKRGNRVHPEWRDLQLMDLWPVAANLAVKDVLDGGADFRNRFWGTRVCEGFGVEGTGKTPREILSHDEQRETALTNFQRVVETDRPVLSYRRLTFIANREHISFEGLHLPLGPADGRVTHIISAYDFDCEIDDILGD